MQSESDLPNRPKKVFAWLWLVFFLQGMALGFWLPTLTNILEARGLSAWVATAFIVPPLCALVSPLIGGALADQRVAANRLYVWSALLGSGRSLISSSTAGSLTASCNRVA